MHHNQERPIILYSNPFLISQDSTLGKQKPIMHRKEKSICDNNYMPNDLYIFFRTFCTMTNMKKQYLMFKIKTRFFEFAKNLEFVRKKESYCVV